MRILLVDDHPWLTGFISDHLRAEGFAVDAFGTADDAGLALETTPYSAVILDLGLPDADGGEVLRTLRARRRDAGADSHRTRRARRPADRSERRG